MSGFFLMTKIPLILGMLAAGFLFFIPKALNFFIIWQHSKNSKDFSLSVNCSMWAFLFISFAFTAAIQASLRLMEEFSFGIEKLIFSLLFTALSITFLTPKIVYFFQLWKKTQKTRYFSLSIFFVTLEFYGAYLIYLLYIPIAYI